MKCPIAVDLMECWFVPQIERSIPSAGSKPTQKYCKGLFLLLFSSKGCDGEVSVSAAPEYHLMMARLSAAEREWWFWAETFFSMRPNLPEKVVRRDAKRPCTICDLWEVRRPSCQKLGTPRGKPLGGLKSWLQDTRHPQGFFNFYIE